MMTALAVFTFISTVRSQGKS